MTSASKSSNWASWVDETFVLFVFQTNHDLMAAEADLKGARVWSKLTPKPRTAGNDCQFALAVRLTDEAKALEALGKQGNSPHLRGTLGKDNAWTPRK